MLGESRQYLFEVSTRANKIQIRDAVESLFKVEVKNVNVLNVRGKIRRVRRQMGMTRKWKKAVVSLKPGHRIELFEGV